eukprot:contig_11718_g2787
MAFAPVFSAGVTSRRLAQQSAAVSSSLLNRTAGRPAPGVAVRPFFHRATGAGSRGLSARSAVSTPKMAAGDKNGATVEVPSIAVEVTADAPSGELLIVALHAAASPSDDADDADGAEAENEEDKALSLPPQLAGLDASLSGALSELLEDATFSGSAGSSTPILRMPSGGSVKRVALVGLGKAGSPKVDAAYRDAGSFAIKTGLTLKAAQAVRMAFADLDSPTGLAAVAEGAHLAMFSDSRFKGTLKASVTAEKKREERLPRTLSLSGVSVAASDVSGAIGRGAALAAGVTLTKQLVAAPANVVTPTSLAETAQGIAAAFPDCECEILEQADCEALGMGSFLAVGRGSSEPPKFIHLTYKPAGASAVKKVCLVGKGITFDSGGYNIKAGAGSMIALMKFDMGGSGTVLGAARAIAELKPNVEVHFIVASCENMVSANAYRPGDIITASNGKTIEVGNTDAEGRLSLADALVFAEKLGDVDYIVDLATLTGAMIVSLGHDVAGLFSTNDGLAEALTSAGKATGDPMWRLPLVESYREGLNSSLADMNNIGGKGAGSITAALFLREFVKKTPWAHIDIAGTAWSEKKGGATGFGVRALCHWVSSLEKDTPAESK